MKFSDLEEYFKSAYNFERLTTLSNVNWYRWKYKGYIPYFSQRRLERITGGALKASVDDSPEI